MMRLYRVILNNWPLSALVASIAMLGIAHTFETFGHLAPCTLCLRQREVYWAAFAVAIAGAAAARTSQAARTRGPFNLLLGAIFLFGAGLAGLGIARRRAA